MKMYLLALLWLFTSCTEEVVLQLRDNTFSGGLSTIKYLGIKEARLSTSAESSNANDVLKRELLTTYTDLNQDYYLRTGGVDYETETVYSSIEFVSKENFSITPLSATLNSPRYMHTATKLMDGRVLIVGGVSATSISDEFFLSTIEIFDPATNLVTLSNVSLSHPRIYHTATLLPNGKVLILGGTRSSFTIADIEVYDPVDDSIFTLVTPSELRTYSHTTIVLDDERILVMRPGASEQFVFYDLDSNTTSRGSASLSFGRNGATATLLNDGKVIFIGGSDSSVGRILDSIEIYDTVNDTVTISETSLLNKRTKHFASLGQDGQIIILGGASNLPITYRAEFYNPLLDQVTGIKKEGAYLNTPRIYHSATLLNDGRVLFVGGTQDGMSASANLEAYEIEKNVSERLQVQLETPRLGHTATLLKDGRVLIAGGSATLYESFSSLEIFDPSQNTITTLSTELNYSRFFHNAILLNDGRVLFTGGIPEYASTDYIDKMEVYDPLTNEIEIINLGISRAFHTSSLLNDGRVLFIGGADTGVLMDLVEVYDPALNTVSLFSANPSPAFYASSSAKLFDGRILFVGGLDGDFLPRGMSIYDPVLDVFTDSSVNLNFLRAGHSVVLLADGRVLIAGGQGSNSGELLVNIEIYNPIMYFAKIDLKVSGGTAPYRFEVLSGEAEVIGGNQLVGTMPGIVKIRCEDAVGIEIVFEVEFSTNDV